MKKKTLIKSRFQGMYWCAHKTTTLTSIQHTVPPTSAYVIYEWYLILLFFFINHSPIDYFFAYVFLYFKKKKCIFQNGLAVSTPTKDFSKGFMILLRGFVLAFRRKSKSSRRKITQPSDESLSKDPLRCPPHMFNSLPQPTNFSSMTCLRNPTIKLGY